MNLLEESVEQLRITCQMLGVNENIYRFLSHPQRTVTVNFPVKMDSGTTEMFEGIRVLHSSVLGPGKGGIQYTPDCSKQDIQALAMLMTWKSSLIGLPLGGAKGAVLVDPKRLSRNENEQLTRAFTRAIINIIGPNQDIPSPDIGTDSTTMAWMMDTYSMGVGRPTAGVVTGKPVEIGGSLGRERAVGWGLAAILRDFTTREAEEMHGAKIVIQGLGHVGQNAAITAAQYGAKIVGISDSNSAIINEDGLDIHDLIQYKAQNQSLKGYARGKEVSQEELLCTKCDAILPCAASNQITKKIAEKIQCRAIIEGANHPTTFDADMVLEQRDITVIPDVIANAGGLISSYFEWVQDISALAWTMDRIQRELNKIILGAFESVVTQKKAKGVSYRRAAHMLAVQRVATAIKYRGIYP